ncbi:MAG: TlpA family protein disulfide reductase [Alkalispirochaeta sp.]
MPDAISIGPAAVPVPAVAGLISLALIAIVLRLAGRNNPEIQAELSALTDRLFSALMASFVVWKVTPLFFWWDAILDDPMRLLRLPGGRPGLIAALIVFLLLVAPRLWNARHLLRPVLASAFAGAVGYAVVLGAISTFAATASALPTEELSAIRAPAVDDSRSRLQAEEVPLLVEGSPAVVTFWATWCGPCHAEIPVKQEAYRTHGETLRFVAVNMTHTEAGPSSVIEYVNENSLEYPVIIDRTGEISQLFGVRGTPTTVVLAADGTVVERWMGPSDLGRINRAIEQARAASSQSTPTQRTAN